MKIKGRCLKICSCGVLTKSCPKHTPSNFCNCGKLIAQCLECQPHMGRCGCGKLRSNCQIHGGWNLCVCTSGQQKSRCTKCGNGWDLCEHKKRPNNCMTCLRLKKDEGVETPYLSTKSEVCPCGIARKHCNRVACGGGSHLCVTCRLTITKIKHTECGTCRRFRNGDEPLEQKEHALKKYLDVKIEAGDLPVYTISDKVVDPGLEKTLYGANRPDFLWKLPDRWVFLECDENQHKCNTYGCERRRELELCNCSGILPVFFIRFNPDVFSTGSKSSRVKVVAESTQKRHEVVLNELKRAMQVVNPTGLTFVKLFFDCSCVGQGSIHECNFVHSQTFEDHGAFLKEFQ